MGDSTTAMNGAKFQCCELPSLANTNASPSVVLPVTSRLVEDTATTDISISDANSVINGKAKKISNILSYAKFYVMISMIFSKITWSY